MQHQKPSANRARSEATRHALIQAARERFFAKGYADTSTPEIVAAAGITRGALYHHFADKRALFRAVVEEEARAVANEIDAATPPRLAPRKALVAGSLAYLDAMSEPGRTRLLLIEGPAVLGSLEMSALDEANAARTLHAGLQAALPRAGKNALPLAALSALLSAAFDRAALAIDGGADPQEYRAAMVGIIERVLG